MVLTSIIALDITNVNSVYLQENESNRRQTKVKPDVVIENHWSTLKNALEVLKVGADEMTILNIESCCRDLDGVLRRLSTVLMSH